MELRWAFGSQGFVIHSSFGFRKSSFRMNPVYFLGWCLFRMMYAVYFRWQVFNAERVPVKGGVILASNQNGPRDIVVDETNVFWTNQNGGTVMKVALAGGIPVTLASGQTYPQGIAIDSTNVYWVTTSGGTVMKVAK